MCFIKIVHYGCTHRMLKPSVCGDCIDESTLLCKHTDVWNTTDERMKPELCPACKKDPEQRTRLCAPAGGFNASIDGAPSIAGPVAVASGPGPSVTEPAVLEASTGAVSVNVPLNDDSNIDQSSDKGKKTVRDEPVTDDPKIGQSLSTGKAPVRKAPGSEVPAREAPGNEVPVLRVARMEPDSVVARQAQVDNHGPSINRWLDEVPSPSQQTATLTNLLDLQDTLQRTVMAHRPALPGPSASVSANSARTAPDAADGVSLPGQHGVLRYGLSAPPARGLQGPSLPHLVQQALTNISARRTTTTPSAASPMPNLQADLAAFQAQCARVPRRPAPAHAGPAAPTLAPSALAYATPAAPSTPPASARRPVTPSSDFTLPFPRLAIDSPSLPFPGINDADDDSDE